MARIETLAEGITLHLGNVLHDRVTDYLNCGWHLASVLGYDSCLMQWLCDCPCVEPKEA